MADTEYTKTEVESPREGSGHSREYKFDKTDRKILHLLQHNARMSAKDIAKEIFLSSPAVTLYKEYSQCRGVQLRHRGLFYAHPGPLQKAGGTGPPGKRAAAVRAHEDAHRFLNLCPSPEYLRGRDLKGRRIRKLQRSGFTLCSSPVHRSLTVTLYSLSKVGKPKEQTIPGKGDGHEEIETICYSSGSSDDEHDAGSLSVWIGSFLHIGGICFSGRNY